MKAFKICVFGDSIAHGWFDFEKGGWVSRLKIFLEKRGDFRVFNLSIPGDTSNDLIKRVKSEIKPRKPELVIIAIGINDCQFFHKENKFRVEPEQFENNILKLARDLSKQKIIFIGLTPVDENLVNPLPRDKKRCLKNEFVKNYNEIIRKICESKNLGFVDIFNKWINLNYKKFLFDGLHPNNIGHEKIFREVLSTLKSF